MQISLCIQFCHRKNSDLHNLFSSKKSRPRQKSKKKAKQRLNARLKWLEIICVYARNWKKYVHKARNKQDSREIKSVFSIDHFVDLLFTCRNYRWLHSKAEKSASSFCIQCTTTTITSFPTLYSPLKLAINEFWTQEKNAFFDEICFVCEMNETVQKICAQQLELDVLNGVRFVVRVKIQSD